MGILRSDWLHERPSYPLEEYIKTGGFSYTAFSDDSHEKLFDYSGTSPLGHLYTRDTSIQRDTKVGQGKMFT